MYNNKVYLAYAEVTGVNTSFITFEAGYLIFDIETKTLVDKQIYSGQYNASNATLIQFGFWKTTTTAFIAFGLGSCSGDVINTHIAYYDAYYAPLDSMTNTASWYNCPIMTNVFPHGSQVSDVVCLGEKNNSLYFYFDHAGSSSTEHTYGLFTIPKDSDQTLTSSDATILYSSTYTSNASSRKYSAGMSGNTVCLFDQYNGENLIFDLITNTVSSFPVSFPANTYALYNTSVFEGKIICGVIVQSPNHLLLYEPYTQTFYSLLLPTEYQNETNYVTIKYVLGVARLITDNINHNILLFSTSTTQILNWNSIFDVLPENSLAIMEGINFYSKLITMKDIILPTAFENVWWYDTDFREYPTYIGDGTQWNKIKN